MGVRIDLYHKHTHRNYLLLPKSTEDLKLPHSFLKQLSASLRFVHYRLGQSRHVPGPFPTHGYDHRLLAPCSDCFPPITLSPRALVTCPIAPCLLVCSLSIAYWRHRKAFKLYRFSDKNWNLEVLFNGLLMPSEGFQSQLGSVVAGIGRGTPPPDNGRNTTGTIS